MAQSGQAMVLGRSGLGVAAWPRPAVRRPKRKSRAIALDRQVCQLLRQVRLSTWGVLLAMVLGAVVVVSALWADEATAITIELREAGYSVQSVEQLSDPSFPGNAGERVTVPAGSRLYRLSYRSPSGQLNDAYRLANGPFGDRWSFPDER